jgi:cytoskeletal protein CcmA (bactofilin family)
MANDRTQTEVLLAPPLGPVPSRLPLLKISGEITGEGDLEIDGQVEGKISLPGHKLTVGQSGRLNCDIDVREMVVYGRVEGNILVGGLIHIKKDATVIGKIRTARIHIEDGARFDGYIETEPRGAKS